MDGNSFSRRHFRWLSAGATGAVALAACGGNERLIDFDEHMKLVPGLATAWHASADAKEFTLDLRHGVTFHDGAPFDAEAVKTNFDGSGTRRTPEAVEPLQQHRRDRAGRQVPRAVPVVGAVRRVPGQPRAPGRRHHQPARSSSRAWADGNLETDWRAAAVRGGNAVLSVNPLTVRRRGTAPGVGRAAR